MKTNINKKQTLSLFEFLIIFLVPCIPLFLTFPYRINIFLSWEGAYRMSQGQIPYKDFGMPLGYMYWAIPAFFFKIFGAKMITLIKAQVFINIISGLAFRSILKNCSVHPGVRLLSVILYTISFSFFNFWPWYNHTVIVYQFIGLAFLTSYIFSKRDWYKLSLCALFTFFSFFTKQDGGGLALLLVLALLVYDGIVEKKWMPFVIFTGSYLLIAVAMIAPLTSYNFGYWFNYGQAPHTSRFSPLDLIEEFFGGSQWIKFYLFLIILIMVAHYKSWKTFLSDKKATFFLLLTLGILVEAAIFQVTSYTPTNNNIFFHSFAFAFIFSFLADYLKLDFSARKPFVIGFLGLMLWWSGIFWKYMQRFAERVFPPKEASTASTENVINKKTYVIRHEEPEIPMSEWTFSRLKSFEKIYMPKATVEGIDRLLANDTLKNKPGLRVLNMTELTPLTAEMPFQLERGTEIPLWHHLGVGMFNKEAAMFEKRIVNKEYDVVLFEHIPNLNNFYPFRTRDTLLHHYTKIDSFPAPRRGDTQGIIEVYYR